MALAVLFFSADCIFGFNVGNHKGKQSISIPRQEEIKMITSYVHFHLFSESGSREDIDLKCPQAILTCSKYIV